uniref:Uncharacterized protein n=1 Tax=Opuntia streptacantha TaxID=393608 RepID=A0A7C9DAT3_OPUST
MVLVLWELSHQLCHLTMEDMIGAMVMEVLIGTIEISIGKDIGRMIATLLRCQKDLSMNHGEPLTMNRDRRKTHVSVKVGTLMRRKMMFARIVLRRRAKRTEQF